ncbi:hypothetical protein HLV39_04245 [Marinobacter adhaerens]|uniref:Uncharacterized protein n=1 Tax=Marinobacter adhaerens TaxID=1033846 RepID=A0A851HLI2_9GAMM|nr:MULTISPECIES: hypothetical protein [Marinobacter]NWN90709.1 hypothetical protein [Marinobacter adhaerens]
MIAKHLRMRSLVTALLFFALIPASVKAQDADDFLAQLHSFRVSNYIALDAYYRFIGSGSTDTLNEIVAGINAANTAMKSLEASTSDVLTNEQTGKLNTEFRSFKNLMRDNINDVRTTGFPDLRLVSDMANQAVVMNDMATGFYEMALEDSLTNTDPRIEAARMGAVKIARMMAKYAVRTNSSVSQTFQGSATDLPLDEQAREFDRLLETIDSGESANELTNLLGDVSSKWQFIRGSYINYNENNVGFVIDRYSKHILEGLTQVIDMLEHSA